MNIIDFVPPHLLHIRPQASQRYVRQTLEEGERLASGHCFTGLQDDEVVAIGGVLPVCAGRAWLHLIVAEGIPHQWVTLTRVARRLIAAVRDDYVRLETLSTTPEGDRWLALLGFHYEGVLRRIMPDGGDATAYSIIQQPKETSKDVRSYCHRRRGGPKHRQQLRQCQ